MSKGMKLVLLCLVSLSTLRADDVGQERAKEFLSRAKAQVDLVFSKDAPDVVLSERAEGRSEIWIRGVQETEADKKERAAEKSMVSSLHFTVTITNDAKENVGGPISINVYDTETEAIAWFTKSQKIISFGQLIRLQQLGDEAFRIGGSDLYPDSTGSLYLRKGNIIVQVNSMQSKVSLRLAKLMDRVVNESIKE